MEQLEELLAKLWADTINRKELDLLLQMLSTKEHKSADSLEAIFSEISGRQELPANGSSEAILEALHKRIALAEKEPVVLKSNRTIRFSWFAAACLMILLGGYFFIHSGTGEKKLVRSSIAVASQPIPIKVSNDGSQIMKLTLSDSSVVKLYPNSSITYRQHFLAQEREIRLTGKAFFQVAKDPKRPFTVLASNIATTALGTAFLVNTLADSAVAVKLFEGKVVVKRTDDTVGTDTSRFLTAGQELTFVNATAKYKIVSFVKPTNREKKIFSTAVPKSNVSKSLEFNDEPLTTVFQCLAKEYEVKMLYLAADLEGLFFTGTFSASEDLTKILSIICDINGISYQLNEKTVSIKKKAQVY